MYKGLDVNSSSCALCIVKLNKWKRWGLERKVYCNTMHRDLRWLMP